jgi:cytochrome c biogenesis protein CcmG, thiol:disulfide interchange protein DsbE
MSPGDGDGDVHERSSVLRALAIAAGVAVAVLAAYLALRPVPEGRGPSTPPEFELELLRSDRTLSSAELKGTPVVVNLWASWCDPCRREMPLLETISKRYEGEVVVLGVDVRDAPQNAIDFVKEIGVSYPLVRDPDLVLAEPLTGEPEPGLPQTFFIDERWRFSGEPVLGELSEEQLVQRIEAMIGDEAG